MLFDSPSFNFTYKLLFWSDSLLRKKSRRYCRLQFGTESVYNTVCNKIFIFAGIVTNRRSRQVQKVLSELIEHAPIVKIQSYIKRPARFPHRSKSVTLDVRPTLEVKPAEESFSSLDVLHKKLCWQTAGLLKHPFSSSRPDWMTERALKRSKVSLIEIKWNSHTKHLCFDIPSTFFQPLPNDDKTVHVTW